MPLDAEEIPDWRARRREVILNAAAELFAGRDYASVQVEEVAKRAGVGKATLYRYFPSKEELYLESLERALGGLEQKLNAEIAPQQVPASVRLSAMVSALVGTLSEQLQTLKRLGGDQSELADRTHRIIGRRSERTATALQRVMADGMASGEFRKIDLEIVPILVIGMVRGGIMQMDERPREALERSVIDFLMSGLINLPPFI